MEEILNVSKIKEYMLGYYIVTKIYDIRDLFLFSDEPVEYKALIMNLKILDLIREVNFVFVKDVGILDQIKQLNKVGNLLNFEVFLDPYETDNVIRFIKEGEQEYKLKIEF